MHSPKPVPGTNPAGWAHRREGDRRLAGADGRFTVGVGWGAEGGPRALRGAVAVGSGSERCCGLGRRGSGVG